MATIDTSKCVMVCKENRITTPTITIKDFKSNPLWCTTIIFSSLSINSWISFCCPNFWALFRSFLKNSLINNKINTKTTAIVGPKYIRKELKSIPAADPIKIFGGSPIKVADPPTFEAKT